MHADELKALFDQQAADYDQRWAKTAPIRDALLFLLDAAWTDLPADARVLCVGAGTGTELGYLAERHPGWQFTALDPSPAMIERCREHARSGGWDQRCQFHVGYLDSLPSQPPFHAATALLVSQFLLERAQRIEFFRQIAARLAPQALLVNAELCTDTAAPSYPALLRHWLQMLQGAGLPAAGMEQVRATYARDVAIVPPAEVEALLIAGGFTQPVLFHQAGLIRAWWSVRTP